MCHFVDGIRHVVDIGAIDPSHGDAPVASKEDVVLAAKLIAHALRHPRESKHADLEQKGSQVHPTSIAAAWKTTLNNGEVSVACP